MAYAEAIAHGLPVIGTQSRRHSRHGAGRAGLLVAPGDVGALGACAAAASSTMPTSGKAHGGCARAAAPQLPTWRQSAEIFARALETLA